jgi:hypothetical protein
MWDNYLVLAAMNNRKHHEFFKAIVLALHVCSLTPDFEVDRAFTSPHIGKSIFFIKYMLKLKLKVYSAVHIVTS